MPPNRVPRDPRQLAHLDAVWKRGFQRRLLGWFGDHARDLPWRRAASAYEIWVSEIMLQQTQVATVIPYYERFLARFPHVRALAAASESEVLRLWEGLGYYRRGRQLHAAAQQIVARHGARFPSEFDSVLALPGIGRYTAGAILSIAFDARRPILEANTIRLYSRLLAYRGDPLQSAGQRLLWRFAEAILPRRRVGSFNQALMELGSEICTPRNPQCGRCPVAGLCAARQQNLVEMIPSAKKKTVYEELREASVVVRRNGRVLLRRCQPPERWAGLWDFPRFAVEKTRSAPLAREIEQKTAAMTGVRVDAGERLAVIKHGVTRFRITLLCHEATYAGGRVYNGSEARWLRPAELEQYPLSVAGRKISRLLV